MIDVMYVTLLIVLVLTGCGYIGIVASLTLALGAVREGASHEQPTVSVIVAARNEEKHIGDCLLSLRRQDYPVSNWEVIVVNDRSEDGTAGILDKIKEDWHSLHIITIDNVYDGESPKKHALFTAIKKAKGDIILQTDADCIVSPTWISGMIKRFESGVNMVAGVAPYQSGHGMIARFVAHEYLWNVLLSAGSINLGAGTHASGRNMAFRKTAFLEINGYGSGRNILSGDDTLLLQRMQRFYNGGIVTNPKPSTHVYTDPPISLKSLVKQRLRHMSTGRYFHPFQIFAGLIMYGFHTAIVISLLLSPFLASFVFLVAIALLCKIGVDAIGFTRTGNVFSLMVSWKFFILGEVLCTLYFSLFPLLGTITTVTWKENH